LTAANWITIVLFIVGGVSAILVGQYHLITRLLADKWKANDKRLEANEIRQDEADEELRKLGLQVNTLETVCKLRHPVNLPLQVARH
jgi:hypothetical protein